MLVHSSKFIYVRTRREIFPTEMNTSIFPRPRRDQSEVKNSSIRKLSLMGKVDTALWNRYHSADELYISLVLKMMANDMGVTDF